MDSNKVKGRKGLGPTKGQQQASSGERDWCCKYKALVLALDHAEEKKEFFKDDTDKR